MLKLVKTTGGSSGSPTKCSSCSGGHFMKSGLAWHCSTCGVYYPTDLGFNRIKELLEIAQNKSREFKAVLNDLEVIVKE